MSETQDEAEYERLDFGASLTLVAIMCAIVYIPLILGKPILATISWWGLLVLMWVTVLWVGSEMRGMRAAHDFTSRTANFHAARQPLSQRIAGGFSTFVSVSMIIAALPVYLVFMVFAVLFQLIMPRAASTGVTLFVSGTAVSAFCILAMSLLVYLFRIDQLYWMGDVWIPLLLNLAAFLWLLHAVMRPRAVSEAWRISAWPAWLILSLIVLASIGFGAVLHLDLMRRLGVSHGGANDLAGLLPRFLDLPGLTEVAALVRQAGSGEILRAADSDTLLNLQWTAIGILLALTSFQLVWKVFSTRRGEQELVSIANLRMSMGNVEAARDVAENQMTESMLRRHDILAQVAAVEGDIERYWRELEAYSERSFYDLFQSHRPYLLHWQSQAHLEAYRKRQEAFDLIHMARYRYLEDSPVLLHMLISDVLRAGLRDGQTLDVFAERVRKMVLGREQAGANALACLEWVAPIKSLAEAQSMDPFVPAGADPDEARVWTGIHLLFGLYADQTGDLDPEDRQEEAAAAGLELRTLYEGIENAVVKFYFFYILSDAIVLMDKPLQDDMSARYNASLRTGVAAAQKKLTRYLR